VAAFFAEGPYIEWWNRSGAAGEPYEGLAASLAHIRSLELAHGPFDTVLGFSQGASLAACLVALAARDGDAAPLPRLRRAVLCSGFVPRDRALAAELFGSGRGINGDAGGPARPIDGGIDVFVTAGVSDNLLVRSLDIFTFKFIYLLLNTPAFQFQGGGQSARDAFRAGRAGARARRRA
jgi:hypothetical protein